MKMFTKFRLTLMLALLSIFAAVVPLTSQATSMTDYLENKIIDAFFRAQAFTMPATIYVSLHTAACSDSSTGTEVSGGSYARVAVTSGLTAWAGTQSADIFLNPS
jgi:hypothetical protein